MPSRLALVGIFLVHFALVGCAGKLGPRTVPRARFHYNQAIVRSWNEQLLLNLVRLRYRDTPLFLSLDSVLTQYALTGSARVAPVISTGGGSSIVGLEFGADYEERPTITYTPLQGEDFSRRFLSPIAADAIILLSQSGWSIERLLLCCVQEINDVRNAPSASGPTPSYVPPQYQDFQRVSGLLRDLQMAGNLDLRVESREKNIKMLLEIGAPATPELVQKVEEVKRILDLDQGQNTFRVTPGSIREGKNEVAVTGRSVLGVFFYLSQSVVPPEAHENQGFVTITADAEGKPFDWATITGRLLRIQSQAEQPADAFARVYYRDHWFYIGDSDLNSKSTFNLLTYVFSLQASGGVGASPLLTVPVR